METVRKYLDEAFRLVAASRSGRLAVHNLHERDDDGARRAELGVADYADVLPVSVLLGCGVGGQAVNLACRYFSLFVIYTPYTIYKCEFPVIS